MTNPGESAPAITVARLSGPGRDALPLLVLGPSLGTSVLTLWSDCAAHLTQAFDVVAWDLPGHGYNTGVGEPFTMADLASGVLVVVEDILAQRGESGASFAYAGVSVGGAVGLQLLLDAPSRVASAVLLCTGARLGAQERWQERIAQVEASGTACLADSASSRWVTAEFAAREPDALRALVRDLGSTRDAGYLAACAALAGYDVRHRLGEVEAPVLSVAGARDASTPTALLEEIATGVRDGRVVVLPDVAHLAPLEAPVEVARLIRRHVLGEQDDDPAVHELAAEVARLGAEHPGRSIWTRPGLDQRSRALVTLAVAVAGRQHDELADHVRAARVVGLSREEIEECLMQTVLQGAPSDRDGAQHDHDALTITRAVLDEETS